MATKRRTTKRRKPAKRKKPKLGTGKRFAALEKSIARKGNVRNPGAVAASIGRKKYGAKKMGKWSGQGRHRAAVKRHRSHK